MDSFCGGNYWDLEITWNTTNPDFTPCFEKTALTWTACGFLWLLAPLDIFYSFTSPLNSIPKSPLSVTKYGLTLGLLIIEIIHLYFITFSDPNLISYYPADFVSSVIKISTYTLFLTLLYYSRKKGIRSSGIQFLFWLLLSLIEALRFRTFINEWQNEEITIQSLEIVVQSISFPCIVGLLFLSCWADLTPRIDDQTLFSEKPCPEESASFLSRILYDWLTGLIWKGYKNPIVYKDLWDLNADNKSNSVVKKFDKYWTRELQKAQQKRLKHTSRNNYDTFKLNVPSDLSDKPFLASIVPALLGAYGSTFFLGAVIKLMPDILSFVSPQILELLITYTQGNDPLWKGIFYAVILFVSAFISTIITAKYTHMMYLTAMRVRTALVSAIYRKALLLSNASKKKSTVGEIVNLMSVDVQKIMDLIPSINTIWSAPFQIGLAMYFLWGILGPSSLAGLGVMVLMIPANSIIVSKSRKLQMIQMKKKDLRVKMMSEILSGIKVLKLYAWERSFEEQIMKIRREEMEVLKKAGYLVCTTSVLWNCAQFLVALFTFGTYVLVDKANVLDAQKAFVSLSLFNIISMPLNILPMVIASVIQASVSIKRLNKYMNSEELDPQSVSHDQNEEDRIVIEEGYFAWEPEAITLRDINLRIPEGSLVAIVGPVGSGKSSILSAMLGEINKMSGRVNTKGKIAYVAQQAWIQNASLKDNILFGKPFDPLKYNKIVETCDLLPDLEVLPAGDETEIGEKGINLSGGQKQRVSLARAAYNNADIYLLDDPLSAVDSHVGKHIFDKVLGPKGLLKRKTKVLVTHGIAYLSQMDSIIVMKDGEISEMGTYRELLARKGVFAEFLKQYVSEQGILDALEDPQLIQDLEAIIGKEVIKKSLISETSGSDSETSGLRYRAKDKKKDKVLVLKKKSLKLPPTNKDKLIQVEQSETASVKLTVYRDYLKAAGWGLSTITIIMYSIVQVLSAGSNVWLSDWSNQPPAPDGTQDIGTRNLYLGVYTGFGILQGISIFIAALTLTVGTLRSSFNLHSKMLQRILHAPMSFFDTTPIGRIVNRFAKDTDVCDTTLPFNLRVWLIAFTTVIATLSIISYSTPIFISVIIPIGILYTFVQRVYVSTSRQLRRLESTTRSPIYSHFGETINGASTIRAYSEQARFISESESKVDHNQVCYFPSITSARWLSIRLGVIGNLLIFFAALFAVLGKDTLSSGIVGLSVSYALRITTSLSLLVQWTSDVETNIVAVERLKEYGEVEQEADWEIEESKPPNSWPDKGEVKFEHYQTKYRPGLELVLKDITCKINPGEKVGIAGRTGAGKSSLTLALFRIIEKPTNGSIMIDGQDISRLGLHDLRGRITIIPQDPVLFSGTLRLNLDPFEQHSDETLWQSLELAHLKSFAKSLAAGLNHEITEGGENLSVGQRQLVCLARALLRKTKILVLDEATAAVDLETDDLIQQTIRNEFKDSTVITIAHRLNTIMDSTRVLVLDKGCVKEFDSPQNLLNNENSMFFSMAKDAGLA